MKPCDCVERHAPRRVVLTGGPGTGKSAVLELIRLFFCEHVKTLPESAVNQDNRAVVLCDRGTVDGAAYWSGHPHRVVVDATEDFLSKASQVLRLLRDEVPECCRHHVRTFLWDGDTRARRLAARAGEQA